jgi:hydrogenase maturation protein HypF
MALEAAAADEPEVVEPFTLAVAPESGDGVRLTLVPSIRDIVAERDRGTPVAAIAARFHETVAALLADAATRMCAQHHVEAVALSGGCFANRRLLARTVARLEAAGRRVCYHRHVPCGDGGLALGQALVAAWRTAGAYNPGGPR